MPGDAMQVPPNEELVRVSRERLIPSEHDDARWTVYLIGVHLKSSVSSA
jgi:hypothetical protein